MNKVILTGRLTRDWERNDASTMIKNSIAVDGYKDKVDFINLTCFNERQMDNIENYTHKGSKVAIDGRLSTSKTQDGKVFTNVVVDHVEFLDSKSEPKEQEPVIDGFDRDEKSPVEKAKELLGDDALWS